jgi:hypothetical protein
MKKQNKWLDNYGKADNANESNVTLPEGFVGMGYDTKGRDYSPAWGGQFQTGGSIPGTVGFTYARTINPAPSEGKYAKKTLPSAQNGIQQDATRVNNNVSDKLWGIQRELDAQKLSDDSFREKYGMPLHQFKMRDAEYASAFQRQMEQRRMSDPNYAELNLPQTDVRSRIYQGNPNLGFIPGTSKGESRAAIEDTFLATTTATAPLLPINTAKIAKGAQQLGKYLTEETALRNAYKLNPFVFKPNPEAYYRGIGRSGLDEALERGVIGGRPNSSFGEDVYMSSMFDVAKKHSSDYYNVFNKNFWKKGVDKTGYIAEIPRKSLTNPNNPTPYNIGTVDYPAYYHEFVNKKPIPLNEVKLLKQDWLRGYKPIEVPKKQNGGEMKFYQEGLDWKPKSMQDGGQQPLRVSTTDPRYAELYKNRQVGSWSPQYEAYNLPDLPEVTVTGKDESLKEAMSQGSNRFFQNALGVLGSSQTVPMELLTGKQQTPSEAWGFNTEGLSWYNPKSISNFAMDAVLDPMNAIGVGVADDILRASGRSIGKRVEFDPTQLPRLEPVNFNYDLSEFKRRNPPQLTNYEDDELITNTLRNFATDNQLPPPPSEIRIPDSGSRQLTAAEKRQGVKDFLNYRDISSLGIQNVRDTEEALNNWLTRNRFELPSDINIENRMSNLFNRYNIQSDDYNESIRNLPQDVKPQFLQELISTLPRKFSDDELIQMRMRYQDTQTRYQNSQRANAPSVKNRSGLTKDEVIQRSKDKDKVSKMTEEEFQNTVLKPSGEIADYVPGMDIDKLTYDPSSGRTILKDQVKMSEREYADAFNQRIDLLNEIIADRNKSGVEYKVKELSPSGYLTFETPSQNILDTSGNPITINPGESQWTVRLNPGQWKGDVEDIANSDYYRSIPGLEMSNTTGTVFADRTPRKGTGAYESINEYLKRMDLGRVKPGFNSQTAFSKGAWENFIKTGRGVGYYANPNLVYGTMKTLLPIGFGASYLSNQNSEFKKGGVIKDNRGQWDHPGEITEIDSPYITMEGVPYPVIGKSNTGDTKLMLPGENYKFKGKKVTEFPLVAQRGGKVNINDLDAQPKKKLNQLLNFTNNPDKNWLDNL